MTREDQALELAKKAFNTSVDIINGESPDMGVALAACTIMVHWLQAEVDSKTLLGISKLQHTVMEESE